MNAAAAQYTGNLILIFFLLSITVTSINITFSYFVAFNLQIFKEVEYSDKNQCSDNPINLSIFFDGM